ncbi:MAG: amidohydrolase family protein [Acidobacteria bacterium]|nr:amidohydrolase family protein [Acidobacteriota bacterium]
MGAVLSDPDAGSATPRNDARLVVAGGTVWTANGPRICDVLVERGQIAAFGEFPRVDAARIDASGRVVLPGFIDMHVHIDDEIGPWRLADDLPSGSRAAVLAGVTTIGLFVTQHRDETLTAAVTRVLARVPGRSLCDLHLHLTPTGDTWDWDEIAILAVRGFSTFKLYTTYRQAGLYTSWLRIEGAMRRFAQLGVTLLLHCEDDDTLAAVDVTAFDLGDPFSQTLLRPEAAEIAAIGQALELAGQMGCRLHVVHVSTAAGAEAIAAARAKGCAVTCETGPQYLLLSNDALRGAHGHRFLCSPPLRPEATRARLEALAAAGAIDLFATDHCPYSRADEDAPHSDVRRRPNGLPGLGALPGLAFELFGEHHGWTPGRIAERLSGNPARVLGLQARKGSIAVDHDADLVVASLDGPRRAVRSTLADTHDPWADRTCHFDVRDVLVRGVPVVREGSVVESALGRGRAGAGE